MNTFIKNIISEFIGSFMILLAVAGTTASGSASKQIAIALTVGLMILILGKSSKGYFNPAVSIYFFARREISFGTLAAYVVAQLSGAFFGVASGLAIWGGTIQPLADGNSVTPPVFAGEVIATAGLVFIIGTLVNNKQSTMIWGAAAAWILAAGTFTVTGAMANPAVAFGLMFNGISTGSIGSIIVAQLVGLLVAVVLLMILGADVAKKAKAKKESPKKAEIAFVPAPVVVSPVSAQPAAKKPVSQKPVPQKPVAKVATAKKPVAAKVKPAAASTATPSKPATRATKSAPKK